MKITTLGLLTRTEGSRSLCPLPLPFLTSSPHPLPDRADPWRALLARVGERDARSLMIKVFWDQFGGGHADDTHIANKSALRFETEDHKNWIRKEVSAVIYMSMEFLKDMDMRLRDVRRVERFYYGNYDFGAGKIYTTINNKFEHMCSIYKNATRIYSKVVNFKYNKLVDSAGMLQFMCDYNELMSLVDLFRDRYTYWKNSAKQWNIRDIIKKFLVHHKEYPFFWDKREDEW